MTTQGVVENHSTHGVFLDNAAGFQRLKNTSRPIVSKESQQLTTRSGVGCRRSSEPDLIEKETSDSENSPSERVFCLAPALYSRSRQTSESSSSNAPSRVQCKPAEVGKNQATMEALEAERQPQYHRQLSTYSSLSRRNSLPLSESSSCCMSQGSVHHPLSHSQQVYESPGPWSAISGQPHFVFPDAAPSMFVATTTTGPHPQFVYMSTNSLIAAPPAFQSFVPMPTSVVTAAPLCAYPSHSDPPHLVVCPPRVPVHPFRAGIPPASFTPYTELLSHDSATTSEQTRLRSQEGREGKAARKLRRKKKRRPTQGADAIRTGKNSAKRTRSLVDLCVDDDDVYSRQLEEFGRELEDIVSTINVNKIKPRSRQILQEMVKYHVRLVEPKNRRARAWYNQLSTHEKNSFSSARRRFHQRVYKRIIRGRGPKHDQDLVLSCKDFALMRKMVENLVRRERERQQP